MDDAYQYSEILDRSAIRLILLQPSPDLEAEIRCSLIEVSLAELEEDITEHYVALSYVWGDQSQRRSAWVDERRLDITASLDCAVRHIRRPNKVLKIWADGICINQNDIEERNQQVQLMGSVYTLAQHTIIFLGPSDVESEFLMQCMASQKYQKYRNSEPTSSIQEATLPDDLHNRVEKSLLAHPWFTRVWVLQELVLSKEPWIQKGGIRLKWDQFCKYALPPMDIPVQDSRTVAISGMNAIRKMHLKNILSGDLFDDNISVMLPGDGELPGDGDVEKIISRDILRRTLLERRGAGVSDPRDMIYGHLGFLEVGKDPPIEVSYGKSVCDVFKTITRYFIEKERSLDILKYIDHDEPYNRQYGLPSWVLDWTVRRSLSPHRLRAAHSAYWVDPIFPSDMPHVMIVQGILNGRIQHIISDSSDNVHTSCPVMGPGYPTLDYISRNVPCRPCIWWSQQQTYPYLRSICVPTREPDPLKRRITQTKLKDVPETVLDACLNFCIKYYDNVQQQEDPPGFKWDNSYWNEKLLSDILEQLGILLSDLSPDQKLFLQKFAVILDYMHLLLHASAKSDNYLAILDTGNIVVVSRLARVGDIVCELRSLKGVCILRHTDNKDNHDAEILLSKSAEVIAATATTGNTEPIQLFKLISTGHESVLDDYSLDFYPKQPKQLKLCGLN
ncbi:hypothetical protein EG329_000821 [Mollisiaceae sp. DMI_Dod_QoI]|nr:hypothetical protein EG329_000821 [Helotiales sp. DMI_Dod_QoI]